MSIDYVIHWTDDSLKNPFKLSAQATNTTATSLVLSGKGAPDWGEAVQQDMIRLLENFCSTGLPPPQPTVGQLWFNKAQNILKCYWQGRWNDVGYQRIDSSLPPPPPNFPGDLWYDMEKDVLKVYNGSIWEKTYQGGLPQPETIPVPTPTPAPVTPTPTPITPTPAPSPTPGVPTPTPAPSPTPGVPTPTPVTPTPTVSPTPTPTVSPTPSPTPVSPSPTPTPTPTPTPVPTPSPTPTPVTPTPIVPVPTPVSPPTTPPTALMQPFGKTGTWNLVFHDEFDTTGLNTNNWVDRAYNQSSTGPINYSVGGGSLKIWPTSDFSPRYINTDGKWAFNYGYIEVEARMPTGQGLFPAFFMFSHSDPVARPEIDFAEVFPSGGVGYSDSSNHPINYRMEVWKASSNSPSASLQFVDTMVNLYPAGSTDLSAGFHKYAVNWDSTGIEFYFDGHFLGKLDDDGTGYFNKYMYLNICLLYGNTSGNPGSGTPTGSGNALEVNYVRVWAPQPGTSGGQSTTTPAGNPGPIGQDGSLYELSWNDEFNGPLDTSTWTNHEWFTSSNASINYTTANGALKIWPQRDSSGQFFDRVLTTDGNKYVQYGYVEVRAKLPHGQGLHPVFWLYNRDVDPYGNSVRPEIDLFEAYTSGGIDNGWSDANNNPTSYQVSVIKGPTKYDVLGEKQIFASNLTTQFHTYGIRWTITDITFYLDGNLVYTCKMTSQNVDTLISAETALDNATLIQRNHIHLPQLYIALLNRSPDVAGYNFWYMPLQNGTYTLDYIATQIIGSAEWVGLYGSNVTITQFITIIYNNAFGRQPDTDGLAFWTNAANSLTRGQLVVQILDANEHYSGTDPDALNSVAYLNTRTKTGLTAVGFSSTSTEIVLVNNIATAAASAAANASAATIDTRMYFNVGLLMGTSNDIGGSPDSTTPTTINDPLEIDYVRFWTIN